MTRATTPSMKLRSYLETISDLTLPRLITLSGKKCETLASKEAGIWIKYDENQIRGLFPHSLETGLHHEAVRKKVPKKGVLATAIKRVEAKLAELRKTLKNQGTSSRKSLCTKCLETDEIKYMTPLFPKWQLRRLCRGCKRQISGNGKWLPQRDRK